MFCSKCGNNLKAQASQHPIKFCNKCGVALGHIQQSNTNSHEELIGYWLMQSTTEFEAMNTLQSQGMMYVYEYRADGTGVAYITDVALVTERQGTLYNQHNFTWMANGPGRIISQIYLEGSYISCEDTYEISNQTAVFHTYHNGETIISTFVKLPSDFEIYEIENSESGTAREIAGVIGEFALDFLIGRIFR